MEECIKYYANILTPFSALVKRKIEEFAGLGLPLKMICPSHGTIWRDNPMQIVTQYLEWAGRLPGTSGGIIVYDTMWNGTRRMAEAIAEGLGEADPTLAGETLQRRQRRQKRHRNGSFSFQGRCSWALRRSTGAILSSLGGFLEMVRGLGFKGTRRQRLSGLTVGAANRSNFITAQLKECGFEIVSNEGIRALWNPDGDALGQCRTFGRDFGQGLKG